MVERFRFVKFCKYSSQSCNPLTFLTNDEIFNKNETEFQVLTFYSVRILT